MPTLLLTTFLTLKNFLKFELSKRGKILNWGYYFSCQDLNNFFVKLLEEVLFHTGNTFLSENSHFKKAF